MYVRKGEEKKTMVAHAFLLLMKPLPLSWQQQQKHRGHDTGSLLLPRHTCGAFLARTINVKWSVMDGPALGQWVITWDKTHSHEWKDGRKDSIQSHHMLFALGTFLKLGKKRVKFNLGFNLQKWNGGKQEMMPSFSTQKERLEVISLPPSLFTVFTMRRHPAKPRGWHVGEDNADAQGLWEQLTSIYCNTIIMLLIKEVKWSLRETTGSTKVQEVQNLFFCATFMSQFNGPCTLQTSNKDQD